jgi:hypothetical protein
VGWDWIHLAPHPLLRLFYQPQTLDECGAVGGIRFSRGNWCTQSKPTPISLCPPQIPHDLGSHPGCGKATTNRLSYGTVSYVLKLKIKVLSKCLPAMVESYGMGFHTLILSTHLGNGNIQLSQCSDGLLTRRSRFDSPLDSVQTGSVPTQPPIRRVPGALPQGVKRQGREADHSPPINAEVKNGGVMSPLPHISSCHCA